MSKSTIQTNLVGRIAIIDLGLDRLVGQERLDTLKQLYPSDYELDGKPCEIVSVYTDKGISLIDVVIKGRVRRAIPQDWLKFPEPEQEIKRIDVRPRKWANVAGECWIYPTLTGAWLRGTAPADPEGLEAEINTHDAIFVTNTEIPGVIAALTKLTHED